jgi:hypothetical protein
MRAEAADIEVTRGSAMSRVAADDDPHGAEDRGDSRVQKVRSMLSPFCGTNPIHVKWSWLDPRILVLTVQARRRAQPSLRTRCQHAVSVARICLRETALTSFARLRLRRGGSPKRAVIAVSHRPSAA